MKGLIDERKTPERGGKTLAVREKVQKKSDVSVVVVEFLQLTVVVCRAFSPEVPHDPPQFSHRGNQQPGWLKNSHKIHKEVCNQIILERLSKNSVDHSKEITRRVCNPVRGSIDPE